MIVPAQIIRLKHEFENIQTQHDLIIELQSTTASNIYTYLRQITTQYNKDETTFGNKHTTRYITGLKTKQNTKKYTQEDIDGINNYMTFLGESIKAIIIPDSGFNALYNEIRKEVINKYSNTLNSQKLEQKKIQKKEVIETPVKESDKIIHYLESLIEDRESLCKIIEYAQGKIALYKINIMSNSIYNVQEGEKLIRTLINQDIDKYSTTLRCYIQNRKYNSKRFKNFIKLLAKKLVLEGIKLHDIQEYLESKK